MAIQVVTSENFQQLVETGRVDTFKPPEAPKPKEGTASPASADGSSGEVKGKTTLPPAQTRSADGKFTKSADGDTTTPAASNSSATGEDDDEKDLPEVVRQKIGKKHRQAKEAEEFARGAYRKQLEAEQRAEQLQRQLEATRTKSGPASMAEAPKEPKPEDFKTVGEYTDALVSFRVDQRLAEEKAKGAREKEEAERAAREQEYVKRLQKTREKYDDFDRVLASLKGTDLDQVHTDVTEFITESDHGPELLYHLAKNPDVLDRLRKLSPKRFIAELGKLEAKWEGPATPAEETPKLSDIGNQSAPTPAVSRAPAPIAALSTDKSAVVHKDPKDMTFAELRAYERQREAERRAARH